MRNIRLTKLNLWFYRAYYKIDLVFDAFQQAEFQKQSKEHFSFGHLVIKNSTASRIIDIDRLFMIKHYV